MNDLPIPVIKEGLERRYKACLDLEHGFDLAVALHDYVQYLNDHSILDYLFTEKIQADARKLLAQIAEEEARAEKQLDIVFKVVEKRFKDNKIEHERIGRALDSYKDNKSGRIRSSMGKIPAMAFELRDAIFFLADSEHRKIVEEYIIPNKRNPRIIKYKIGKAIELFELYKERFKRRSEVTAWGAFDAVFGSYKAIKAYTEEEDIEVEKNHELINDSMFLGSMMETIKNKGNHSDTAVKTLFRDYSKDVLSRLQLALLDELEKYDSEGTKLPARIHKRVNTSINKNYIKEIIFVERKSKPHNTYKFYVNGDIQHTRLLRGDSAKLRKLILLAKDESVEFDNELHDYVNFNINCTFYDKGKYDLTKIIERDGTYLRTSYGIRVRVISETEYRKKLNKDNQNSS